MRYVLLVALALLVGACEIKFTMPAYQPVTTDEMKGAIAVQEFEYRPKQGVKPNEIRETAAGTVLLTEPVATYFSNAVRRELRQAGLSLVTDRCTLSGTVHDFAVESLGFEATYMTDVEYRLLGTGPGAGHTGRYQVKFSTNKFVDASIFVANVQKSISDNIRQLFADPAFRAASARCRGSVQAVLEHGEEGPRPA